MCNTCKNTCTCQKPLKIEVGKTYLTVNGFKVKCIGNVQEGHANLAWPWVFIELDPEKISKGRRLYPHPVDINGDCDSEGWDNNKHWGRVIKEYKEPVVHRRDVIWYLDGSNTLQVVVRNEGYEITYPHINKELHRQTVEYIEP